MNIILAVFFLINGEPKTHPNFPPLLMESEEYCQRKLPEVKELLGNNVPFPFYVACYETLPEGEPT